MPPPLEKDVKSLRTWAIQAHGLPTYGISREAVFAILPHEADPLYQFAWAPLERWATEIWDSFSSPPRGNPLTKQILDKAYGLTHKRLG